MLRRSFLPASKVPTSQQQSHSPSLQQQPCSTLSSPPGQPIHRQHTTHSPGIAAQKSCKWSWNITKMVIVNNVWSICQVNKDPQPYWPPPHKQGCGGQWCCPGISKNLILNCRSQVSGVMANLRDPEQLHPCDLHSYTLEIRENPLAEHKLLSISTNIVLCPIKTWVARNTWNRRVELLCPMTKKNPYDIFIDFNDLINSNNPHLTKWFSDLFICVDMEMSEGKLFYSKGDFDDQTPIVFKVLFSSSSSTSAVARALSPSCCHDSNALLNF